MSLLLTLLIFDVLPKVAFPAQTRSANIFVEERDLDVTSVILWLLYLCDTCQSQ